MNLKCDLSEDGLIRPENVNENKRMKYDRMALSTPPLNRLRKFYNKTEGKSEITM